VLDGCSDNRIVFRKSQHDAGSCALTETEGLIMFLSPALYVIHVFGGVRKTARAIGRGPSSVSKWKLPREKDGCEGNIPSAAQRKILKVAEEQSLDITPHDLLYGRNVKKAEIKLKYLLALVIIALA